jgi:hypothetical protein
MRRTKQREQKDFCAFEKGYHVLSFTELSCNFVNRVNILIARDFVKGVTNG